MALCLLSELTFEDSEVDDNNSAMDAGDGRAAGNVD